MLDFFYYTRLLYGAVEAIRALEHESGDPKSWKGLNLSQMIETELESPFKWRASYLGPALFYGLVLVGLLVLLGFSGCQAYREDGAVNLPTSASSP